MTILAGVMGDPVAHSRSPAMHNAGYAALGLDWRYLKLPVAAELFAETVQSLPGSGYRGVNVTIPHKRAALALADVAGTAAAAIGAANTLTFEAGSIEADNTDARGFLDALGRTPAGMRTIVLGAGGAARAVVWALREAGAAEVSVWNRTAARAHELADELGARVVELPEPADLLVNATSVGLLPGGDAIAELALGTLDPPGVVVDLVYRSEAATPVVAWANRAGSEVIDGLEVLVRQGALSFERWTTRPAPLDVMRRAARA
ncbi:MAG: shikimate dehydrogenase [Thermoleophilaceae bacterium]